MNMSSLNSIKKEDIILIRELAKQYAEISSMDIHKENMNRMRATNDLKTGRPTVLISEIPWHEMDIDGQLVLHCTDPATKNIEQFFRRQLFQWKYFPGDMVIEPFYAIGKTFSSTGIGIDVSENTISTDAGNNIVSHQYHDQLENEADLEKLHLPIITADKEQDQKNLEFTQELLGDILPVKLRGKYIYFSAWDDISMLRGVEPILFDIYDRPEFLHKTMEKFTAIGLSTMEQYEKLDLLDYDVNELHCTPPYVSDLPAKDYDGGKVRLKDIWIRSMAQMFSTVSPATHEEFDLNYLKPLFEKCGLVYYGCCEPLDSKIDLLRKIPNMRKIGVSPWANIEKSAEQINKDFVYARKPNPASVAMKTDPEAIRKEISQTVQACIKNGCPYEFVLKDISTVSRNPQNLIIWEKTVKETLDEYYK